MLIAAFFALWILGILHVLIMRMRNSEEKMKTKMCLSWDEEQSAGIVPKEIVVIKDPHNRVKKLTKCNFEGYAYSIPRKRSFEKDSNNNKERKLTK